MRYIDLLSINRVKQMVKNINNYSSNLMNKIRKLVGNQDHTFQKVIYLRILTLFPYLLFIAYKISLLSKWMAPIKARELSPINSYFCYNWPTLALIYSLDLGTMSRNLSQPMTLYPTSLSTPKPLLLILFNCPHTQLYSIYQLCFNAAAILSLVHSDLESVNVFQCSSTIA